MNAPRPLCLRVDSGEAFSETAFERYAYNNRSEVIGSQRFYGSDIDDLSHPVTGRSFGYGYAPIGNRVSSFEAATDATVTVNGNSAWRKGAYFVGVDDFDNVSSDVFAELATTAVRSTAEVDKIESSTGRKFLAQTLEISEYGDDGNMTSDGRYLYAWDGENRLVSLSERGVPTNRAARTVSFRYDPPGRLVSRTVSGGETARLFWLDHIVVLEETAVGGSVARTVNLWGVDVSETLGGAAGVGGLLSVSNAEGTFYPTFDGSGNVSEYLDHSGGLAAYYEYSPFGETLVREGGRADEFAHRFSTKAVVPGTPLYYYGSRFYSPVTGRWLNRDPIEEKGGINLYSFCNNAYVLFFDIFGQEVLADFTIKKKSIKWGGIVKEKVFGKSTSGKDLYGHWWIEFGAESYGWWPFDKVSFSSTIAGVRGEFNGVTNFKGTATTDPHHGNTAERSYHPSRKWGLFSTPRLGYGSSKGKRCKCATVDEIKDCIRSFAASYSGSWSYPGGPNCHTFVKEAMAACCHE